jgi:hypothetical protein
MTQAISIPTKPTFAQAAQYMRPEVLASYENIEALPYRLQAMEIVMMYIAANGDVTHLVGPGAGAEGVQLALNLQGEQHLFFEQVVTESAYQFGATIERVNYLARKINLRVQIGRPGMNKITYLAAEERFWRGQDEVQGGWLVVFTRFSGLRIIPVWPQKTVDTTQKMSPLAYNNNQAQWDINWISPIPYYSKPALRTRNWRADQSGPPDSEGYYHGTLAVPNKGDLGSYVEYLLNNCDGADGDTWLQDNMSDRMVAMPAIFSTDGQVLVDSDPTHKALVAEHDPHDNNMFKLLNATGVINFFLQGNNTPASEALWLRGYVQFMFPIPPNSVAHLRVKSRNPNANIVAQVTQRYKRSR